MELIKRLSDFAESARTRLTHPAAGRQSRLMRSAMRKLGLNTKFKATPISMRVYDTVLPEKIGLIERLPTKYRKDVERAVREAVIRGYDALGLARELEERFGIVPDRAQIIADAQCKIARSIIDNAQAIEQGITEAVWHHHRSLCAVDSHRALEGRRYTLARGADIGGKRAWPSGEPLCFCESRPLNSA